MLLVCVCMCAGRIGPEYVSCELNIGGSVVSSALCDVCGVSRSQLRDMYKQHGDLGDVAQVGKMYRMMPHDKSVSVPTGAAHGCGLLLMPVTHFLLH